MGQDEEIKLMSKPRLTNNDYCRAAETLGCEVAAIKAVANQESLGSGFDSQDRPKILFERHKFHKLTRGIYDHSHPGISNAVQGGYGRGDQYVRFSEAFALNPTAAMMAASWGKFQILGANFAICGFLTVDAFVDAMKIGEGPQLDAFCEFVLHNYLDDELTSHDWAGFARGYNGPTYRKNKYDVKIGAAYKQFAREKVDCAQIPATTAANDGNPILPQPSNITDQSDPNSTLTADTANPETAPDLSGNGGDAPVEAPADPSPQTTADATPIQQMQPYMGSGFVSVIKKDLAKVTGGNVTMQTISGYRDDIAQWGIPAKVILNLAGLAIAVSAIYLIFRLVHYLVWVGKEHQRIKAELAVNSNPTTPNIEWTNTKVTLPDTITVPAVVVVPPVAANGGT